ncbi:MAG: glycosyltransferase family 4 protein [Caldisphaera sp.]
MEFNFFPIMYQTSKSKGQELVAQRMVKWAIKLGYKSYLITSIYHDNEPIIKERELELSEKPYKIFEKDPKIDLPTIRVLSRKVTWPPRRIMFRDFINILNKIDEELGINFIVTHSTLWNGPEDVAKWIMWRKLIGTINANQKRIVYGHMAHYQPPEPGRYDPIERTYRMAWNMMELPSIFKAADLILVVTGIEGEDMITLGANPKQLHIFPGGLDDDEAKIIENAKPDLFIEKFLKEDKKDKKIIAYLGTIEERKNPLAVVEIAKHFKNNNDLVFVIAGRPGDQWDKVYKESKKLKNVVLTGELTVEQKASLIKASYLNIIMSKMEALGLTQIEFMYAGVPVITSAVYGQKWLISNGVDGIHLRGPDDIEGGVESINKIIQNESLYEEMKIKAMEKGRNFLISKLMKELIERAKQISIS